MWPVANGSMETLGGDIRTKEKLGDFRLHVEVFRAARYDSNGTKIVDARVTLW
jgi:hypothetical protein